MKEKVSSCVVVWAETQNPGIGLSRLHTIFDTCPDIPNWEFSIRLKPMCVRYKALSAQRRVSPGIAFRLQLHYRNKFRVPSR